jgi:hypothetical protein
MDETAIFIGLDVHKETIAVAIAEGGRREAARYFGQIEKYVGGAEQIRKEVWTSKRQAELLL